MHILQGYVAGVADIDEARALCILVGALAIPGAANPELLPIVITVAVDGSRTCDGEAVAFVGVDEGREVFAGLAFDAGFYYREVGDAVAAFQFSAFFQIEMGLRFEEEGTALIGSGRNHDDAAAFLGCTVDDCLDGLGLNQGAICFYAIVGEDVFLAEGIYVYLLGVAEPGIHLGAVGPKFGLRLLGFLLFLCGIGA